MNRNICSSYHDIFSAKYKRCSSKKDYKRLCKEMIYQYGIIDKVDENQMRVFSSMIGENTYLQGVALAIKMLVLENQGISTDIVAIYDKDLNNI